MGRSGWRRWTALAATGALLLQLCACGTLLYPERQGQKKGRVDPAIVLFDGALLLLFVLPGVVAYGIDFYTGAIYLPGKGSAVSRIDVDPEELDATLVRNLVREHTGVDLQEQRRSPIVTEVESTGALTEALRSAS